MDNELTNRQIDEQRRQLHRPVIRIRGSDVSEGHFKLKGPLPTFCELQSEGDVSFTSPRPRDDDYDPVGLTSVSESVRSIFCLCFLFFFISTVKFVNSQFSAAS
ncbi:hypothetical protein F2P81_000097 [Scophthalmus maximus]|uniref:Uncharacterized protein n=1 Tax=Scophthalmus maximus TaxID=52904 RepID=A0A6A4TTA0_SCOMX|nr:hypothetical protein F2P81_000097 [Scophthalmus maximus]